MNVPKEALETMTDAQLVLCFQQSGCNKAFAELYTRYYTKVFGYSLKSTGDEEGAADVTQEVFLRAFQKLYTLKNEKLWIAWLFSIARNEILNIHRKNMRHRKESAEQLLGLADEILDIEAMEAYDRQLHLVHDMLENQSVGKILKMKYLEGRSIQMLCEDFKMKESAVKMRLLRARQMVAKVYHQNTFERA